MFSVFHSTLESSVCEPGNLWQVVASGIAICHHLGVTGGPKLLFDPHRLKVKANIFKSGFTTIKLVLKLGGL